MWKQRQGQAGTCLPAETSILAPSELGSQGELWAED